MPLSRHQARSPEEAPLRVVVVGGGAGAVITAVHLLGELDRGAIRGPLDLTVVEKDSGIGPGLAYRTAHPLHTLNNYAGRLSAVPGDDAHLLRWCARRGVTADAHSFLPRHLYGTYLAETLAGVEVPQGSALHLTRGLAVDVVTNDDVRDARGARHAVVLDDGRALEADVVVLALGNPPPRRQPTLEPLGERYVADPWTGDLLDRATGCTSVLLVGTGLTMVDVAAALHHDHPDVAMTAVSRSVLLPRRHRPRSLRPHDGFHPGTYSLDDLLDSVDFRVAEVREVGGDWRDVVDAVRGYANELWRGFSAADQDRFVAEVSRRWDTHRHRMAPDMATCIDGLRATGALELAPADSVDPTTYDLVVNCSGMAPVQTPGWNPLVDRMVSRGVLSPHRLGLGVDLDDAGRPIDARGRVCDGVYLLGAARKGLEWEVTAIPDLRAQAVALAADLTRVPLVEPVPA